MKRFVLILIFLLFLATGCKTVYVPVESVRTEYKDHTIRDSVHIHDSVFVREKGDTVWLTRWRTAYRDRVQKDSIIVRDSIRVPYPVEVIKTVEKKLSWWQKLKIETGGIALGVLAALLIYIVIRMISQVKSLGWKGLFRSIFKR